MVTSIAEQVQEFVRKKMNNANDVNENRAALLVIRMFILENIISVFSFLSSVCFVCAGQNFYIELSNKLEPTLRGYKQMSVDANLCELVVKLTVILVKVILINVLRELEVSSFSLSLSLGLWSNEYRSIFCRCS